MAVALFSFVMKLFYQQQPTPVLKSPSVKATAKGIAPTSGMKRQAGFRTPVQSLLPEAASAPFSPDRPPVRWWRLYSPRLYGIFLQYSRDYLPAVQYTPQCRAAPEAAGNPQVLPPPRL